MVPIRSVVYASYIYGFGVTFSDRCSFFLTIINAFPRKDTTHFIVKFVHCTSGPFSMYSTIQYYALEGLSHRPSNVHVL